MEYILVAIVSFLIGWNLAENHTKRSLRRYVTKRMEEDQQPTFERIQIRVEKHGEKLFAYRVDNDAFLSQSNNGKDLVEQLREKFNDRTVNIIIHADDGAEYIKEYF